MNKIDIRDNKLIITIEGFYKILAVKSKLEIEAKNITAIRKKEKELYPPLLRMPGTQIPGIITSGTYIDINRKEFWNVKSKGNKIVIELNNEKYTKVVLNVDNAEEIIEKVNEIIIENIKNKTDK
jgi:hypothetical protein